MPTDQERHLADALRNIDVDTSQHYDLRHTVVKSPLKYTRMTTKSPNRRDLADTTR